MIEPLTMTPSFMLAVASMGLTFTLATVAPVQYAAEMAAGFAGMFGGITIQLWTMEVRKPTRRVIIADMMASFVSGIAVSIFGVPTCLAIINKLMPAGAELTVPPQKLLWATLFFAWFAGAAGAGFIRKRLDTINPDWARPNGNSNH